MCVPQILQLLSDCLHKATRRKEWLLIVRVQIVGLLLLFTLLHVIA